MYYNLNLLQIIPLANRKRKMLNIIFYSILSTITTYFVFRLLLNNSRYLNLYDIPDKRKIHNKKILKIGGLGIIFSFLFILSLYRLTFNEFLFRMTIHESQVFIPTIFLIIGGLLDDIIGLDAPKKLFFQLLAIVIIIKSNFLFVISFNVYINIIFTIIFFIVVINSMNLIDGIDGLSSGIFIIYALSMIIVLQFMPIISNQYFILIGIESKLVDSWKFVSNSTDMAKYAKQIPHKDQFKKDKNNFINLIESFYKIKISTFHS